MVWETKQRENFEKLLVTESLRTPKFPFFQYRSLQWPGSKITVENQRYKYDNSFTPVFTPGLGGRRLQGSPSAFRTQTKPLGEILYEENN